MVGRLAAVWVFLLGCEGGILQGSAQEPEDAAIGSGPDVGIDAGPPDDSGPPCSPGEICNPIVIDSLPFADEFDTTLSASRMFDGYACAASTDESGPERFYRIDLSMRGLLSLEVTSDDGADLDVHLLAALDPDSCVERNDMSVERIVEPGTYFVVVDTWVNNSGVERAGGYRLNVTWMPVNAGDCAMQTAAMSMWWSDCDGALDCFESDEGVFLRMPAEGPVVKEAHLVTADDGFGDAWPTSFTDAIDNHYAITESASGYEMERSEPWAPAGEGGSEFGQGSYGRPLPVVDEVWYVNMYWRNRPAPGTRMIIMNPRNGRTVVAAGGYETGPGANTAIGGASEEIHHYLGTSHRESLVFGFAVDGDLPLGPIDCE